MSMVFRIKAHILTEMFISTNGILDDCNEITWVKLRHSLFMSLWRESGQDNDEYTINIVNKHG